MKPHTIYSLSADNMRDTVVEMVQLLRGMNKKLSLGKPIQNDIKGSHFGGDRVLANPNPRTFRTKFLEKEGATPREEEQPT